MNAEDKQALIEFAESVLANYESGSYMAGTKSESLIRIALAALTAQPVKLPDYTPEVYPNHALENQKIKSRNEAISDCADAIRAAGYEVQE